MRDGAAPRWLQWAQEIQALSQTGNHYAENEYQRERYHRLAEIAAEIVACHTGLDFESLLSIYSLQDGYATPRVDVRGAVFREGKLLLVRERADGGWTMPGGWADVGDQPSKAAEREVWEEAGFRVKARRVIGIYDANRAEPLELFHGYKIVFLCELLEGEARPNFETSAVAFFGPDEVPPALSGERTRARHIQDAFEHYRHPELPAVFD
jgi:ADP-ribose pyrophosphatase YjhB (NUDIX family)